MRICITGGSGFIGSFFYDALISLGHELVLLDVGEPRFDAGQAAVVKGDVRSESKVREAIHGCDAVLHLAAAHHDFGVPDDAYFDVNVHGTEVVLKAMDDLDIKDICFFSSVAVYGDAPEPCTERSTPRPNTPYGRSKWVAEQRLKAWAESENGRRCLVIRSPVVFGPRNTANMFSLIRHIHSGTFLQFGSGANVKSLAYVENIVDATVLLWGLDESRMDKAVGPGYSLYAYIDKPDLTSRQIVETIHEALGRRPPKLRLPLWLGTLLGLPFDLVIRLTGRNLPVSTARVKKLGTQTKFEAEAAGAAGIEPKVPLRRGISNMVEWYLREGQFKTPTSPPPEVAGR